MKDIEQLIEFDRLHVWHPYASMSDSLPVYPVRSARGVRIELEDGRQLIDGMSSWWSVIHGYNHPVLNKAVKTQLDFVSHVMFGGFTHRPAVELARMLVAITPSELDKVFFADSGSVAVEVAIKMAFQYWKAIGVQGRSKLLTVRGGYHGDTFGAMSVCDPVGGMHSLFTDVLTQQIFAEIPRCRFDDEWDESFIDDVKTKIAAHRSEGGRNTIAAIIIEPIVQGAGGMRFYSPMFVRRLRELCDENDILLIFDEIATGFGRSGKLFALEHAGVVPDILCLGKALTGGMMTLSAVLTTETLSHGISAGQSGQPGLLMHGPTFMANPLACAVAKASIDLLLSQDWAAKIKRIEAILKETLEPAELFPNVAEVRVLGAIGVIEMREPVDVAEFQRRCVAAGIWVRPFGKLVYLMPPYVIEENDLRTLAKTMLQIVEFAP